MVSTKVQHTTTNVIGIDPGKSGGIVVLSSGGKVMACRPMPSRPLDIFNFLMDYQGSEVFIERVNAGPRMASSAAFKFGIGFGGLIMACIALNGELPKVVDSRKWQKHFDLLVKGRKLGEKDNLKKKRNLLYTKRHFGKLVTVVGYNVDGRTADALLIAMYGRDKLLGRVK